MRISIHAGECNKKENYCTFSIKISLTAKPYLIARFDHCYDCISLHKSFLHTHTHIYIYIYIYIYILICDVYIYIHVHIIYILIYMYIYVYNIITLIFQIAATIIISSTGGLFLKYKNQMVCNSNHDVGCYGDVISFSRHLKNLLFPA